MKILPLFFLVLAQLASGSAMVASWMDARHIRKSYFEFTAALAAAIFLGISLWQAPVLSPFLFALFFALAAIWSFRLEHFVRGRLFLKASGLAGVSLGLYSLADGVGFLHGIPNPIAWLLFAGLIAGALLLGGVHATMVLGHWYLIMRNLDFKHLRRATKICLSGFAEGLAHAAGFQAMSGKLRRLFRG